MPVAIVIPAAGSVSAILDEKTETDLVARLNELDAAPDLNSTKAARDWLAALPAPSGWYSDAPAALAAAEAAKEHASLSMTRQEFKAARKKLGMSGANFGRAIGYVGKYVAQQIHKMEDGDKPIPAERAAKVRAMLAVHALESA